MTSPHLADALGHDTSDKRLDILRRVDEAGSISEAARGAGVSYKAAWQAVETLSNLAGTPLVERVVGGSGGGGARLTEAGRQLLQLAQRLHAARAQIVRELRASGMAESPPLLGAVALRTSMRNQLPCRVQQLQRQGSAVRVRLALNDEQTLASRITRESAQLLDLKVGQTVLALCKATAVQVSATQPAEAAVLNQLSGQVTRGAPRLRGGEISLLLPGGLQLVGLSEPGQGLARGTPAWAVFAESAVVIALPS